MKRKWNRAIEAPNTLYLIGVIEIENRVILHVIVYTILVEIPAVGSSIGTRHSNNYLSVIKLYILVVNF